MSPEQEIRSTSRSSRAERRRPGAPLPEVEKIRPRSLSREQVVANQRRRIFDGFAAALVYHGYEDTKVTDVLEFAGVSRATFYERFESKEACFAAAFEDGVGRLVAAIEAAVGEEGGWDAQLSVGLGAALDLLAAEPATARLLFVEALAASRSARDEYERSLGRLADALRALDGQTSDETVRLLAGGLASHISGRLLADEAERLSEDHDLLRGYLCAAGLADVSPSLVEQRVAQA